MINLSYYQAVVNMKNLFDIRKKMALYSLKHGISSTAVEFSTTRKTVRKWRDRYLEKGVSGLTERSRAPKKCPHKLSQQTEQKIIKIRKKQPYLGPYRIKEEHNINASCSAIYRVLKEAELIKPRKKKYKTKRDLRKLKQKLKPFQKIQVDIKELQDIPQYYPYILKGLPKYQFSARDVRTGISFISFGFEKSATNVGLFMAYLCAHLDKCNVELSQVEFQSDNGSEFIGAWNRKEGSTPFESIAKYFNAKTTTIPPGRSTYNSDVEAMHSLIENEFYDMEHYENLKHFLSKAFTYLLYFNALRKFRYKFGKSPVQILTSANYCYENALKIANFKPLILDYFISKINLFDARGGYHVPRSDNFIWIVIKYLFFVACRI